VAVLVWVLLRPPRARVWPETFGRARTIGPSIHFFRTGAFTAHGSHIGFEREICFEARHCRWGLLFAGGVGRDGEGGRREQVLTNALNRCHLCCGTALGEKCRSTTHAQTGSENPAAPLKRPWCHCCRLSQAGEGRRDPSSPCGVLSFFGRFRPIDHPVPPSRRFSQKSKIGWREMSSEVYAIIRHFSPHFSSGLMSSPILHHFCRESETTG
jgi:hypothetical protein